MTDVRLLILDDDPMIGSTIQMIAQASGVACEFTTEPADFFRRVPAWRPTHIAVDLNMPQMDGVQVLAELARQGVRSRIIITSGVGQRVLEAAERSAAEHGLDIAGILPKPFVPAALRRLLSDEVAPAPGQAAPPAGVAASVAGASTSSQPFRVTEANLRQALQARQFHVVYQPKTRCFDGELSGFEALVRWRHPEQGLIRPDAFIPLAEETGLIDALTEQVFEEALAWFAALLEGERAVGHGALESASDLSLSVNISARSLKNTVLIEGVSRMCERLGIASDRIILELTETSTMERPVEALDLLTRLRMRGFKLSIDDFGTGFSSMLQLVRLPFSEIKVDRSFVMTATRSEESRTVIRSIVDLARNLGLISTAEGVEDEDTLVLLRDIGCDLAQGFGIARPMEGAQVVRWMHERYPRDPESWRLATLRSMRLLDTPPEERFDRITRLAKQLFGVPVALVSLVDRDRQWFKSRQGLDALETPREISFCTWAVQQRAPLVVQDTLQDPRFADNPLVLDEPRIRFYAGCPVSAPNGSRLGTLCIIDTEPRTLSDRETDLLQALGSMVDVEFRLDPQTSIDRMTGLSNRGGFEGRGEATLQLSRCAGVPASLLFFDLHGLRRINEARGPLEGDRALLGFARLLRDQLGEFGLVARFGGDEFVAILFDADETRAADALRRVRGGLELLNRQAVHPSGLTVDTGSVTMRPDDQRTLQALLAAVDTRRAGGQPPR